MSVVSEFKEFALKGNVVDLAVGVIIGAAFGKIVSSLVDDIISPILGLITGGIDFAAKKIVLKEAVTDAAGKVTTPESAIKWGLFINNTISFVLVAFVLFLIIKAMNKLRRQTVEEPVVVEDTKQEKLLMEIRDALKTGR